MIYPHYYQRLGSLHQDKCPGRLNSIQLESLWVKQLAYLIFHQENNPEVYDWGSNNIETSCLDCTACSTRNNDVPLTVPLSKFKIHRCQSSNKCKQRKGSYWLQLILADKFKKKKSENIIWSIFSAWLDDWNSLSGVKGWLPSKNQTNKQTIIPQTKPIPPPAPKPQTSHSSFTNKKIGQSEAYEVTIRHGLYSHSHETLIIFKVIPGVADFPNSGKWTKAH